MKTKALWIAAAVAAFAPPAAADFAMQQDAFLRGFNSFAQANGKPAKLTLKFTDNSKMGHFVYDLNGCLTVTGFSKDTTQIIDTLMVTATTCTLPEKVDDFVLLARYLASLSAQGQAPAKHGADEMVAPAFKAAEKTHKKQSITLGTIKIDIELSDVIGWVMRVT